MSTAHREEIAGLLQQAGEVHHVYYADTDGNDDDWASFYSEWLLRRTHLASLLARAPVRSDLTRTLVELDEAFAAAAPAEEWPHWYAAKLIARYG